MLRIVLVISSLLFCALSPRSAVAEPPLSVAVIGHTGRGNYGHGLDAVWLHLDQTKLVAAADPDANGLLKELKRLNIEQGFADYREMLRQVKPDVVAICPRFVDEHHAMCLAAIEAGVKGIYVEKPFCRTPAEADEIVASCRASNVKLAVAHRNRSHPTLTVIDQMIADGQLGRLLEIRGRGKGDRRGGAEDLWVLGSHVLDLIHYFGGPPLNCSAEMLQNGERVTKADVVEGSEGLGPLAGNELHARFRMQRGVTAYFDSVANDGTNNHGFGLQLIGSEGIVSIQADLFPLAYFLPGNPYQPVGTSRAWIPITSGGVGRPEPIADIEDLVGHHLLAARDLIAAIQTDRQPICGVNEAAMTIEMIHAVFASHVSGSQTVTLPLRDRSHALSKPAW